MANLEFKATVSNICKFEKTSGKSLITAFNSDKLSLTTIVELVKALSNATDKDIDDYVAENGFDKLAEELTNALTDSGFLPKDATPQIIPTSE